MELLLNFLILFHIVIWIFILGAFINQKAAKFNLYYLIPFIYILHILPFHVIVESKKKLDPEHWEEKHQNFEKDLVIPYYWGKFARSLDDRCFQNPFSVQGMLLFGAITSAWALRLKNK